VETRRLTFSVIVATLGRPERLDRSLRAAAALDPGPDEVVVVDGDPQRSAAAVVERVAAEVAPLPIRYVESPPGLTRQRNAGLAVARADVVVFLDDDAALEPGALAVLREIYADGGVAGATGRVEEPASNRIGGQRSSVRRLLRGRRPEGTFMRCGYPRRIVDGTAAMDVEQMPGCFMSARLDPARATGFDERLPGYALAEDEDFSYRLSRVGRVRYDPRAVVHHDNTGFAGRDRRAFGRTVVVHRWYLLRKNFPVTPLARLEFAGLVALLLIHRLLNGDLGGARGICAGVLAVARGATPDSGPGHPRGFGPRFDPERRPR
jgi:glycosyltransferase involved in cell wall biosynthesis